MLPALPRRTTIPTTYGKMTKRHEMRTPSIFNLSSFFGRREYSRGEAVDTGVGKINRTAILWYFIYMLLQSIYWSRVYFFVCVSAWHTYILQSVLMATGGVLTTITSSRGGCRLQDIVGSRIEQGVSKDVWNLTRYRRNCCYCFQMKFDDKVEGTQHPWHSLAEYIL